MNCYWGPGNFLPSQFSFYVDWRKVMWWWVVVGLVHFCFFKVCGKEGDPSFDCVVHIKHEMLSTFYFQSWPLGETLHREKNPSWHLVSYPYALRICSLCCLFSICPSARDLFSTFICPAVGPGKLTSMNYITLAPLFSCFWLVLTKRDTGRRLESGIEGSWDIYNLDPLSWPKFLCGWSTCLATVLASLAQDW